MIIKRFNHKKYLFFYALFAYANNAKAYAQKAIFYAHIYITDYTAYAIIFLRIHRLKFLICTKTLILMLTQ